MGLELEGSPSPFGEPTGDTSGIDTDALLNQIENGAQTTERPMQESASPPKGADPAATAQGGQSSSGELSFTHNGKEIKVPATDPRLKLWLSGGYDYNQRMEAFTKQQAELQARQAKINEYLERYQPVEQYIESNPDWWKHVNEQFQQAKQAKAAGAQGASQVDPAVQAKLQAYEQELSHVKEFIQSQQAKEAQIQAKQEDEALDQEIKSVRESYKDLDWTTPDQSGKSLELRVLEHAQKIGVKSFEPAFKHLMHDELIKRAELRAKENVVKERQAQTKLGLLGKTSAPKAGLTEAQDIKNKSYDQLVEEAMREYGVTG